jgi:hypothetical protein
MIIVDTSVWINCFKGIPSWQTCLLDNQSNDPVFISEKPPVPFVQTISGCLHTHCLILTRSGSFSFF